MQRIVGLGLPLQFQQPGAACARHGAIVSKYHHRCPEIFRNDRYQAEAVALQVQLASAWEQPLQNFRSLMSILWCKAAMRRAGTTVPWLHAAGVAGLPGRSMHAVEEPISPKISSHAVLYSVLGQDFPKREPQLPLRKFTVFKRCSIIMT